MATNGHGLRHVMLQNMHHRDAAKGMCGAEKYGSSHCFKSRSQMYESASASNGDGGTASHDDGCGSDSDF